MRVAIVPYGCDFKAEWCMPPICGKIILRFLLLNFKFFSYLHAHTTKRTGHVNK